MVTCWETACYVGDTLRARSMNNEFKVFSVSFRREVSPGVTRRWSAELYARSWDDAEAELLRLQPRLPAEILEPRISGEVVGTVTANPSVEQGLCETLYGHLSSLTPMFRYLQLDLIQTFALPLEYTLEELLTYFAHREEYEVCAELQQALTG